MVLRLIAFWLPYFTELRVFDATVSSPSSIPFVGWAVDFVLVFVGRCTPLCAHGLYGMRHAPSRVPSWMQHGVVSEAAPPNTLSLIQGCAPSSPLQCNAASHTALLIYTSLQPAASWPPRCLSGPTWPLRP